MLALVEAMENFLDAGMDKDVLSFWLKDVAAATKRPTDDVNADSAGS